MGIRLLPKGVEEAVFKRIPGGWLLKAFNPWIFGAGRTYLATEAQKPAIAARVRLSRYANLVVGLIVAGLILAASAKYPWLFSLTPEALVAWGGALVVAQAVFGLSDWLIMRSFVRNLPRSTQTIGMVDRWRSIGGSMSTKTLAFFTVFCAAAAAANFYVAATGAQTLYWLLAPFMAILAIFYGTMLTARRCAKADVGKR